MRHIFGATDEKAGWHEARLEYHVASDWHPKDPVIRCGKRWLVWRRQRCETVMHAERLEDVPLDVRRVRLAGNNLDQQTEGDVVHVGVLEGRANGTSQLNSAEAPHCVVDRFVIRACLELFDGGFRNAACLVQQLSRSDRARNSAVGCAEIRQITLDRSIKVQLALLNELHYCERGKRFTQ